MSTITLHVLTDAGPVPVEMPGSTTAKYAAKRIAEQFGLGPFENDYGILPVDRRGPWPDDEIVADLDGKRVHLIGRR